MDIRIRLPDPATLRALRTLALVAVPLGIAIPVVLLPDGTGAFPEGSPERAVAEAATDRARASLSGPVRRLWYLHARVADVRDVPFPCTSGLAERSEDPRRDLAASVRLHGWFGLPVGDVVSDCGGAGAYSGTVLPRPRAESHPLLGVWEVVGQACPGGPGACELAPDEAAGFLGLRAEYGVDQARFDDTSCRPVSYPSRVVDRNAAAAGLGAMPALLGPGREGAVEAGEVVEVEVRCDGQEWRWPGGRVVLLDRNAAAMEWGGVVFRMLRVDPAALEAPGVPAGDCDVLEAFRPTLVAFFTLPDEAAAPPVGLAEAVRDFRAGVEAVRPELQAIGVAVHPFFGRCLFVQAADGAEVLRPLETGAQAGYLLRAPGVRAFMAGVQAPATIRDFVGGGLGG